MSKGSHGTLWPSLVAALGGAIWGLYWLPIRALEQVGISPSWATLIAFGLVGMLSFVLLSIRWLRAGRVKWGALITGIISGGAMVCYATAFVLTDVVKAILLLYLLPVWTTFLGRLILKEKITSRRILAVVLGLAGLVAILEVADGIPRPSNAGDWLALLSGLLWAWVTIRVRQDTGATAWEHVGCFYIGGGTASVIAVLLPIGIFGTMPTFPALLQSALWLAIFTIVYVPMVFMVLWSSQRLSPTRTGLLLMTEVVVGVATAAIFVDEVFGWRQMAGVILIMGAAVVEVLSKVDTVTPSRRAESR